MPLPRQSPPALLGIYCREPLRYVVRLGKCLSVSPLALANSPHHLPPVIGSLSAKSFLDTDPLGRGLKCYLWTDCTDVRR